MKIVELSIDDLESFGGLDGIALVESPAHQSNWLAFSESEQQIYDILSEDKMCELAFELNKLGEPIGTLEEQGYVLYSIEDAGYEAFATINSNPNPDGESDTLPRIRYKYVGIMDKATNRKFCYEMMRANRVFTREDIEQLSSLNSVGPSGYSVLNWRGSYNCRHKWVKLTYLPKDESGNILNKGSARKGLVNEQEGTLYDTRTRATIAAGNTPEPRVGGFTFNVIEVIDDLPYFSTQEEAERMSSILGCEGFSTWELSNGEIGYAPCNYETFESYNDYPQAASESACKVLEWIDKYGRDEVAGMELTGLARANQLCKREKISEQTIARMAAFERHRENSKIAEEYKGTPWKDKGYVAWLGWGGDEGIAWAQRKLESIRKETFSKIEEDKEMVEGIIDLLLKVQDLDNRRQIVSDVISQLEDEGVIYDQTDFVKRLGFELEDACWPGYEAIGTKELNGRQVPNCVPKKEMSLDVSGLEPYVSQSGTPISESVYSAVKCSCGDKKPNRQEFRLDDDKMEITGAAIIPNKMIIRRTPPPNSEFYYVFFSEDTTRKLAEKFMKEKLLDKTNIEHTNKKADSYVKESWIIEDPEYDKATALGFNLPKSTWMITMKVSNRDTWKKIKEGKLKGFSVEGWFNENLLFN